MFNEIRENFVMKRDKIWRVEKEKKKDRKKEREREREKK
jgi:uncharacterized GH25 family protein